MQPDANNSEPVVTSPESPTVTPITSSNLKSKGLGLSHHLIFSSLSVVLIILAAGGVYLWQHMSVNTLTNQVTALHKQAATLNEKISNLTKQSTSNTSTQTSVVQSDITPTNSSVSSALLYGQQPSGITLPIDNGKITVNSALYAIYFGNSAINNEGAIVDMSVSNNTSSDQTYDLSAFSVQLPNGEIIPQNDIYGSNDPSATVTIAPSGSVEEDLIFSPVNAADTAGNGFLVYTSPTTSDVTKAALVFKKPLN